MHGTARHEDHRALRLKNEAPEPGPILLIIVIVINFDIMRHKACTKQCYSFVFNMVFGALFLRPSEERSHFFFYDEYFRNGNSTKKSFNECIVFANRLRSVVFPWLASHGMWHYMLKRKTKKKVEKVTINCSIQFEGCAHSVSGSVWLKGWQAASCLCCHEGAIIHV